MSNEGGAIPFSWDTASIVGFPVAVCSGGLGVISITTAATGSGLAEMLVDKRSTVLFCTGPSTDGR